MIRRQEPNGGDTVSIDQRVVGGPPLSRSQSDRAAARWSPQLREALRFCQRRRRADHEELGGAGDSSPTSTSALHPRRIALFGIFGVDNLGNECTLQAMVHHVRNRVPGVEVYVICYEPQDTLARHGLTALPVSTRDTSVDSRAGAGSTPARMLRRLFVSMPREVAGWYKAFRALKGTDLMVMTGTGMLTDYSTTAFGFPYDIFKWTTMARLAACQVRFVGIGVGPIYEPLSRYFVRSALRLADYRSYRDQISRRRLEELGFDTKRDPVFPDLAFSLPLQVSPANAERTASKCVVGVGVINHYDPRAPGAHSQAALYEAYLTKMCEFVKRLLLYGYGVRILQGDARYDGSVRGDLRVRLEEQGFAYDERGIVDEDIVTVDALLAQLAETDLVVAPRYHNQLLALLLNKPVISLSYDPKSDALLESVGLGEYCQTLNDFEPATLMQQLLRLDQNAEALKKLIAVRAAEHRRSLERQYDVVFRSRQFGEKAATLGRMCC